MGPLVECKISVELLSWQKKKDNSNGIKKVKKKKSVENIKRKRKCKWIEEVLNKLCYICVLEVYAALKKINTSYII